jgi:hypothetical protein
MNKQQWTQHSKHPLPKSTVIFFLQHALILNHNSQGMLFEDMQSNTTFYIHTSIRLLVTKIYYNRPILKVENTNSTHAILHLVITENVSVYWLDKQEDNWDCSLQVYSHIYFKFCKLIIHNQINCLTLLEMLSTIQL